MVNILKKIISLISIYLLLLSTLPSESDAKSEKMHSVFINTGIEYVNIDFWDSFCDEHLKNYIQEAVKNNYDLKNATLKTEEYKKFVAMSFGQELPHLAVGAQAAWLRSPMVDIGYVAFEPRSTGIYSVPLLVNYEADIFLKNHSKTKAMKKAYEASKYAEKSAYISVASAVATVYYNLVNIDELLKLQKEIVELKEENLKLVFLKVKEGLMSEHDCYTVMQDFQNSVIELKKLEQQQNALLNQLAVLTGESPENKGDLSRINADDFVLNQIVVPDKIESDVVFARPDIMQIEAELEKAKIDVSVARKELLPSFPLLGVLGFGTSEFSKLFTKDAFLGLLSASAMQTLFAGGTKINNLKLKKIQYEELLNKYYQTDLIALQEVNDALCGVKTAQEVLDGIDAQYRLEKDKFSLSELKYKEGLYSKIQCNDAKIRLLSAKKGYRTAVVNRVISIIALYKATGAQL